GVCGGLGLGVGVVVHTNRDTQPLALGIVALKLRVTVDAAEALVGGDGLEHRPADLPHQLLPVDSALIAAHVDDIFVTHLSLTFAPTSLAIDCKSSTGAL